MLSHAQPERLSRDVLAADLPEESILLEMQAKRYFRLNATGQRCWQLLAAGAGRQQVLASLLQEFDVAPAEAAAALDRFLDDLRARGLLRPDGAGR